MEKRLTHRLASYWDLLRKESSSVDFAKFNPSAIHDLWPSCVLLSVQPSDITDAANLTIQHIGTQLHSIYSPGMVGKHIHASQRHFPGAAIVRRAQETIESGTIIYDEGQFVNEKSKMVKFRSCLIPFSTKDRISHLVVGLSWREF